MAGSQAQVIPNRVQLHQAQVRNDFSKHKPAPECMRNYKEFVKPKMQSDVAAGKAPAEIWAEFKGWASKQADPATALTTVIFQSLAQLANLPGAAELLPDVFRSASSIAPLIPADARNRMWVMANESSAMNGLGPVGQSFDLASRPLHDSLHPAAAYAILLASNPLSLQQQDVPEPAVPSSAQSSDMTRFVMERELASRANDPADRDMTFLERAALMPERKESGAPAAPIQCDRKEQSPSIAVIPSLVLSFFTQAKKPAGKPDDSVPPSPPSMRQAAGKPGLPEKPAARTPVSGRAGGLPPGLRMPAQCSAKIQNPVTHRESGGFHHMPEKPESAVAVPQHPESKSSGKSRRKPRAALPPLSKARKRQGRKIRLVEAEPKRVRTCVKKAARAEKLHVGLPKRRLPKRPSPVSVKARPHPAAAIGKEKQDAGPAGKKRNHEKGKRAGGLPVTKSRKRADRKREDLKREGRKRKEPRSVIALLMEKTTKKGRRFLAGRAARATAPSAARKHNG